MTIRTITAAMALASLTIGTTANAAGWLCIADGSTGFSYNSSTKTWGETSFQSGKRYLVRESQKPEFKLEVVEFGDDNPAPTAECREGPNGAGIIFCQGMGTEIRINTKNNRFIYVYWFGYWTYDPDAWLFKNEGGDTPSMMIGKCSAI